MKLMKIFMAFYSYEIILDASAAISALLLIGHISYKTMKAMLAAITALLKEK